jgi:nucleoside-diphosphate-sugar epimerase
MARCKPQDIVHLAAQYSVPYTTESMHNYLKSNALMPTYLFELAKLNKVRRFVYASSIAANPNWPSGLYGSTKKFNEMAAHNYANRGGAASIGLRLGVTYGPMLRADSEIFRTIRSQLQQRKLKLSGQFHSHIPLIYVHDAAEMIKRCLDMKMKKHKAVVLPCVADDAMVSYSNVLEFVARQLGQGPLWPDGGHPTSRGAIPEGLSKLDAFLEWRPPTKFEEGIGKMLAWAQKEIGK